MVTVILAIYAAATPFFYWKFMNIGAELNGNEAPVVLKKKKRRKKHEETAEDKFREDYAWNLEHFYGEDSVQREITR